MNIITKLNIRQRVMLVLTILAAAFLTWQIYNFVHGNSAAVSPRPAAVSAGPAVSMPVAAQIPQVRPLPADLVNPALTNHQQEYLNLVREYQVTKMKRQILEEEAGLANAQKRIVDAGKNGSLPYLDTFGNDNVSTSSRYQLTYLDRQAGQWTATLSLNGQYTEVHVGTQLADGYRVTAISNRGVMLQADSGKRITVGFQGSVNVDSNAPSYPVNRITAKKTIKPVISNNPNNAQIAKMLGITSAPPVPATGALTAPVAHDVPAATPAAAAPAQPQAAVPPAPNTPSAPNPANPELQINAPQASPPPAPAVKPVSVKELRQYNAAVSKDMNQDVDQLSWQQSADQDQQDQSEH